jgi:uncharacterized protein (TIGR03382 family)
VFGRVSRSTQIATVTTQQDCTRGRPRLFVLARALRVLLALAFAGVGLVVGFVGAALVLYGSENGADPYAQIGDHKFGPDSVGGVGIAVGLGAVVLSALLFRRRAG